MGQPLAIFVVELIAVPVPLRDVRRSVSLERRCVFPVNAAREGAQAHGASLVGHAPLALHQVDDGIRCVRVQLAGVSPLHAAHMAGKLHHRHLHSQTDAQKRYFMLPGIADGGDLALDPPAAKAAGYQDAVHSGKEHLHVALCDRFAVYPADVYLYPVLDPSVGQRLHHREVGVMEGHILTHQCDLHFSFWVLGPLNHSIPLGQVRSVALQPQMLHHHLSQSRLLQHQRDLVEQAGGQIWDGVFHRDIAEQGYLFQDLLGHRLITTAQDNIGLDAQREQLLGRVLGGL